jgi:hypothetical protein
VPLNRKDPAFWEFRYNWRYIGPYERDAHVLARNPSSVGDYQLFFAFSLISNIAFEEGPWRKS